MRDDHDLAISRLIAAPPERVWRAWSGPAHLARWWIPKPLECRVEKLDFRPSGDFGTSMREGGDEFQPHLEACFLEVEGNRRLVFTTALKEDSRPIEHWLTMTAVITLTPRDAGTLYAAHVMHKNAAESARHAELGFTEGWGTVIDQLAIYLARSLD
jgi:uncharacterized protein YndB with AHSA1/START domain